MYVFDQVKWQKRRCPAALLVFFDSLFWGLEMAKLVSWFPRSRTKLLKIIFQSPHLRPALRGTAAPLNRRYSPYPHPLAPEGDTCLGTG